MTLYTHQSANVRKTFLLMGLFLMITIGIGWFFSYYFQNTTILLGVVIFAIFMNIISFWYSDKIALRATGAISADPIQYRDLHNIVENLAITAGLPKPRVYIINDPAPNAFATGRDKNHSAVAFTTGLLGLLDKNELEGVAAHELAHIGNRDILLSTVIVVLVGCIALISDIMLHSQIFGGGDRDNKNGMVIIIGIILSILAPLVGVMIQLAISRRREFLADATGALLTRYPEGLARALQKISSYNQPMKKASDATAHLFIANPFGAKKMQGIHKLFMTHPPTEERIKALMNL